MLSCYQLLILELFQLLQLLLLNLMHFLLCLLHVFLHHIWYFALIHQMLNLIVMLPMLYQNFSLFDIELLQFLIHYQLAYLLLLYYLFLSLLLELL